MNSPSDSALKLAVKLSATPVLRLLHNSEEIARTIDKELLLPEKHAALLLAQGVAEVWSHQCGRVFESMGETNPRALAINDAIDLLRTALSKLR